jgi:hypothetical protein
MKQGTPITPLRQQPAGLRRRPARAWIEDADYRVLEVAAREMNLETREYIERVLVNKASQLRRRA